VWHAARRQAVPRLITNARTECYIRPRRAIVVTACGSDVDPDLIVDDSDSKGFKGNGRRVAGRRAGPDIESRLMEAALDLMADEFTFLAERPIIIRLGAERGR
jgi:hypothetical protein